MELVKFTICGFRIEFLLQGRGATSAEDRRVSTRAHSLPMVGDKIEIDNAIFRVDRVFHRYQEASNQDLSFLYPMVICIFETELSDMPGVHIQRRGE